MSDDIREEYQLRIVKIPFWNKYRLSFAGIMVAFALLLLVLHLDYWREVFLYSAKEVWNIADAPGLATLIYLAAVTIASWFWERHRGGGSFKTRLLDFARSMIIGAGLGVILFLLHAFLFASAVIHKKAQDDHLADKQSLLEHTKAIVQKRRFEKPIQLEISDIEARRQLKETQAELAGAQKRIQVLDPTNQPIISISGVAKIKVIGQTNFANLAERLKTARSRRGGLPLPALRFGRPDMRINEFNVGLNCIDGWHSSKDGTNDIELRFARLQDSPSWRIDTDMTLAAFDGLERVILDGFTEFSTNMETISGTVSLTINNSTVRTFPVPRQKLIEGAIRYIPEITNRPNVLIVTGKEFLEQ
ncbi:MAG: hypothetical protein MN733_06135 [Nitrososphaera sp.]|nr:hypothetical protein [Nitrososphaera sp.]